jgi:hypothetical protein
MSYYSRYDHDDSSWWTIIICIALVIFITVGFNTCTASEWNDGECPKCHEDYVLRGGHDGLRYYSCPKCGNEVSRFGGR